ncbi:MAG TPA: hypothetical protein VEH30_04165 [Terriglobales bacterium]|nr:hypothetical protein [Terriglobales bacterium]
MEVTPSINVSALEAAVLSAWQDYKKNAEPRGLEFGRTVYELRKQSEVVQGGTSFKQTLTKLDIPHSTAYFWIARYEESIGKRTPSEPTKKPDFWKDLYHRLNGLVPSGSDGTEHATIVMLEESLVRPVTTQAEKDYRQCVLTLLKQISVNFAEYAQKLSNAEVVQ